MTDKYLSTAALAVLILATGSASLARGAAQQPSSHSFHLSESLGSIRYMGEGANWRGFGKSEGDLRFVDRDLIELRMGPHQIDKLYDPKKLSTDERQFLGRIDKLQIDARVADTRISASFKLLKHLSQLNMNGTNFGDEGVGSLAAFPLLESLSIGDTRITDNGMDKLPPLARLNNINLNGLRLSEKGLCNLSRYPSLQDVSVAFLRFNDRSMRCLCSLSRLRGIDFGESDVPHDTLTYLARLPRLKDLLLRRILSLTAEDLRGLSQLKNLRKLDLSQTNCTDDTIKYLPPYLNNVSLASTKLKSKGIRQLSTHTSLSEIDLAMTELSDESLRDLATMPNLGFLRLEATKVSDASVPTLASMKRLEELDVTGSRMTPGGVARLRKRMPFCNIHFNEQ